jgi:hypothetical protein
LHFGLTLPKFHHGAPPDREHILAVARAAEEAEESGFTSGWTYAALTRDFIRAFGREIIPRQ